MTAEDYHHETPFVPELSAFRCYLPSGVDEKRALWEDATYSHQDDTFTILATGENRKRMSGEEVLFMNDEKAPPCGDMTQLNYLNFPAVTHNLIQRWEQKKPWTFMSVVLVALNPCERLQNPRFDAIR